MDIKKMLDIIYMMIANMILHQNVRQLIFLKQLFYFLMHS